VLREEIGFKSLWFHNFNTHFRNRSQFRVIAFTANQIPDIEGRKYPAKLAGKLYPRGIPIYHESKLSYLIKKYNIDAVYFSYSDVSREYIMDKASLVLSCGANFELLGPNYTMIESKKPLISICATRTGAGKGTVARKILYLLKSKGYNPVAIRHPMPYGKIQEQICQRFSSLSDLDKYNCTLEEREEYLPYIEKGFVIYSGVDYEKILREAEREGDTIVFESGNNDFSFFKSDLYIVVADPLRPEGVFSYPGQVNVRLADLIIINKMNVAKKAEAELTIKNIRSINDEVRITKAETVINVDRPELIRGKEVVLVEDSPSITHGGLSNGISTIVAKKYRARKVVDPKKFTVGVIKDLFKQYPRLNIIPTYGYTKKQITDLAKTLNNVKCDSIIFGSYSNLYDMVKLNKPVVRITYELREIEGDYIKRSLDKFLRSTR